MSIVAYVGLPGSGKSYGVVENVILPGIKSGRQIITNIPLKAGHLSDDYPDSRIRVFDANEPFEDPSFFDLSYSPGALWVIDECWRYWKSGTKAAQIPTVQQQFFTEHRHFVHPKTGHTTEIVLVTQNLDQLAVFVRELIEETYRTTKLTALGLSKVYKCEVFQGAQKGMKGGTPLRVLQGTYKKEVYQYYHSHSQNKTDFASAMETKADNRGNLLKSKLFVFGLPAAVIGIFWGLDTVFSLYAPPDREAVTTNKEQVRPLSMPVRSNIDRTTQAAAAMRRLDISREYLPLSDKWRIVGRISDSIMIWSQVGSRIIPARLCAQFSNTNEDYCVLGGELVTWYSAHHPDIELTERTYDVPFVDSFQASREDAPETAL